MTELQEKVCRVANRISTAVGFVQGSTDAKIVKTMFLDGFRNLENMLFELAQADFAIAMDRVLATSHPPVAIDAEAFTRDQCELLHRVNMHERTIARIGSHMVHWRPTRLATEDIASYLTGLEYVVSFQAEQLVNEWSVSDAKEINRRVEALHAIANGLAIMVVNTSQANVNFSRLAIRYGAALVDGGLSAIGSPDKRFV